MRNNDWYVRRWMGRSDHGIRVALSAHSDVLQEPFRARIGPLLTSPNALSHEPASRRTSQTPSQIAYAAPSEHRTPDASALAVQDQLGSQSQSPAAGYLEEVGW